MRHNFNFTKIFVREMRRLVEKVVEKYGQIFNGTDTP